MFYRLYIFLIFFFSFFFSTATYSQSSKLVLTPFVIYFSPVLRILIEFILLLCFLLLLFCVLSRKRFNTPDLFPFFLFFQTLCLLLVLIQQNFIPRFFTDLIYLLPLPIVILGISNFKRFIWASLVALLFVSIYSFIQLPIFGLLSFLPIVASEGWGARLSGFLGINSHASYLVVLITTLDFNFNSKSFSLPLISFSNNATYPLVMSISYVSLLFTGSRAAILICTSLALIRRMPFFFRFVTLLRIRYIYIFFSGLLLVFLIFLASLSYTQCYSCNYILDFNKAVLSLAPRLVQSSYLDKFITSPFFYMFGTTDLSAPDIVGDNPWLEYTLDYGLLFTLSLLSSFLSLGLILFKSYKFFKSQTTPYSYIYSHISLSFLYGLFSIVLLMLFYDSPQAAPTFLIYLIMCYSFIAFYVKSLRFEIYSTQVQSLDT